MCRRKHKIQQNPHDVRQQSVIQCPGEQCSLNGQTSRCPAEFSTDTEGHYSGDTMAIRCSKMNVDRIDYKQYHETGEEKKKMKWSWNCADLSTFRL